MGAGVAFVAAEPVEDMDDLVRAVFGRELRPLTEKHRRECDVYAARFGDAYVIEHEDFARTFWTMTPDDVAALDATLGEPDGMVIYFMLDTSGDTGCAIIDEGRIVRRWSKQESRVTEEHQRTELEMDYLAPPGPIPWPFTEPPEVMLTIIQEDIVGFSPHDPPDQPDEEWFYRLAGV